MEAISVPRLPLPSPVSFTPLQLCGPGHFLVTIAQANLHLTVYFSQSWEPESGGRWERDFCLIHISFVCEFYSVNMYYMC